MPGIRSLLGTIVLLAFAVSTARAELVWRPGEGWSDESGGDVSASSSRDQLELAHKLEAQGQRDAALKAYRALLRRWPLSFFSPEAQFRVGKILEDEGDFGDAFQAFQKMVTKYPSSEYFDQALNEQYRIANLYLAGEPQRIWKIPVGPSMEKTIAMYDRIIKNAPFGTYAPQCQFNIGLADEKQRKYDDAVDAYQKVIDNYPTSSVAADAQYQIGYAWMRSSITGDYDMGAATKSVEAFQDFLVRYPDSDKAAQAQDNIVKLQSRQTQGAFDVAKFYETQHDTRAAFIYYNEVVREDPNSPQAQQAKKRIAELRPVIESMPGGLGPDGSGSLAVSPKVVSNNATGQSPTAPADNPSDEPSTPMPNQAPPDAASGTLPADPNAPVSSSSPGETAASTPTDGSDSSLPAPSPSSSGTNAAPADAPVASPPDKTPLPQ